MNPSVRRPSHAIARGLVRLSAWAVPAGVRVRWREEWLAEIDAMRGAASGAGPSQGTDPAAPMRRRGVVVRALGAPLDALACRSSDLFDGSWSSGWAGDLRDVLREWRRAPVRSITSLVCLTVGLAATLVTVGVVNAMFAGDMPGVADRSALTRVMVQRRGYRANPTLGEFQAATTAPYEALALAASGRLPLVAIVGGQPISVEGQPVSSAFFDILGTRQAVGRLVQPADDRASAAPVAVISHGLWHAAFGGREDVVGQRLLLADPASRHPARVFEVIGVAPRGFVGVETPNGGSAGRSVLWMPMAHWPMVPPPRAADGATPPVVRPADSSWAASVAVVARLTGPRSRAADELGARMGAPYAASGDARPALSVSLLPFYYAPLTDPMDMMTTGAFFLSVPLSILLLVCVNVAGLRLAGGTARQHELAVRASLGASRRRLVRLLAIEAAGITVLSAALGGAAAAKVLTLTVTVLPVIAAIDWRVLIVAALLAAGVVVLAGVWPALRVTGRAVGPVLATGTATGGASHVRVYRWLAVVQMALSLVLLVCGLLTLRGVQNLGAGRFDELVGSVSTATVTFADPTVDEARRRVALRDLSDRVLAAPGVEAVAMSTLGPIAYGGLAFTLLDAPEAAAPPRQRRSGYGAIGGLVTPSYFDTLRLPVLEGRTFVDADGPGVVVVTSSFRTLLPADRPVVGSRLRIQGRETGIPRMDAVVIGVVGDIIGHVELRHATDRTPVIFAPLTDAAADSVTYFARSSDPEATAKTMSELFKTAQTPLLVDRADAMRDVLASSLALVGWLAWIMNAAGALALGVAAMGLWAVASVGVTRRRREFGVRMAIGADRSAIARLLLAETARVTGYGVAGGVLVAVPMLFLMRAEFIGVDAFDPAALVGAGVLLGLAALAATIGPALRAARVDPVEVLRSE